MNTHSITNLHSCCDYLFISRVLLSHHRIDKLCSTWSPLWTYIEYTSLPSIHWLLIFHHYKFHLFFLLERTLNTKRTRRLDEGRAEIWCWIRRVNISIEPDSKLSQVQSTSLTWTLIGKLNLICFFIIWDEFCN